MPGAERKKEGTIRDNRATCNARWHRMAEALDNTSIVLGRLCLILLNCLNHCGTVAEWLWRHV